MTSIDQQLETLLAEGRQRLLQYIQHKVSDPQGAEDILQNSLLKALQAAPGLRSREKLVPWFYRIVQHAIVDAQRQRAREQRIHQAYMAEQEAIPHEDATLICECFRALLPSLKEAYRLLIEKIDLEGEDPREVAQQLGITRNNLHVRLHRARRQLRERLEALCTACTTPDHSDCRC
jgi:RNA polymerase sigma-70 factor (ECF subfamily)